MVDSKLVEAFRLRDVRWGFPLRIPHCDHFFFFCPAVKWRNFAWVKKKKKKKKTSVDFCMNYLVV